MDSTLLQESFLPVVSPPRQSDALVDLTRSESDEEGTSGAGEQFHRAMPMQIDAKTLRKFFRPFVGIDVDSSSEIRSKNCSRTMADEKTALRIRREAAAT